jgi:hypothetical protein
MRRALKWGGGILAAIVVLTVSAAALGDDTTTAAPAETTATQQPTGIVEARVTGTEGIAFSGNVGTLDNSSTVDGTVPDTYEIPVDDGVFALDVVSVVFQKAGEDGILKVELVQDGEVLKAAETTAAYGVVTVAN